MTVSKRWMIALAAILLLTAGVFVFRGEEEPTSPPLVPIAASPQIAAIEPFREIDDGKWTRSFRAADGDLYAFGQLRSRDGGRTFESLRKPVLDIINGAPERAVFTRPGLFYALDGPVEFVAPGEYRVRGWRSTDALKTIVEETVSVAVPDGPDRRRAEGEWFGLYVYRTIIEMPDGTWRLTMYGNFKSDAIMPADPSARQEVKYQMRSIILTSADRGRSWQYLATIAAPQTGDPVGEGFVEPALTRLQDGSLLSVMRTGHYFPLYASWSSDGGASWSAPVYTGLDRGCDPALITLADGRVALSWGRRFVEGWSKLHETGDAKRFVWPGETMLNLAISSDGGVSWVNQPIGEKTGSGYSTIFEVAPDLLFVQTDHWVTHVKLRPRDAHSNVAGN